MSCLLFVTAPEADHKIINRLLLHLHDWESKGGVDGNQFKLVNTRSVEALKQEPLSQPEYFETTKAPVAVDLQSAWADATLNDIEAFCLTLIKEDLQGADAHLFVVLDADGVKDGTCVLAERARNYTADTEIMFLDEFNKTRVPWHKTYMWWINLEIANVDWSDLTEEDEMEDTKDRWWTLKTRIGKRHPDFKERDDAILELERQGKA